MDDSASSMAWVSEVTLWLMFVSLILTIVGIWFLKRTLDATEAANRNAGDAIDKAEAANKIANEALIETQRVNILQLQPWLEIGDIKLALYQRLNSQEPPFEMNAEFFRASEPVGLPYTIFIPIKNHGKSPINCMTFDFEINSLRVYYVGQRDTLWLRQNDDCLLMGTTIVKPINPISQTGSPYIQKIQCQMIPIQDIASILSDGVVEEANYGFSFNFDIRFKDNFTPIGKHRKMSVKINPDTEYTFGTRNAPVMDVMGEEIELDNGRFNFYRKGKG